MTRICTSQQAREADQEASLHFQIPSLLLMEHAAIACTQEICQRWDAEQILILAGCGNNGGDGLAMARLFFQKGKRPLVYMPKEPTTDSAKLQCAILEKLGVSINQDFEPFLVQLQQADLIVDALFGNGLSRPVEGLWKDIIHQVNQSQKTIVAIDIASGLSSDTGKILGCAIQADSTFALDCFKVGHLIDQGPEMSGDLTCLDIGIPHRHAPSASMIDESNIQIPDRSNFSHKGTFGKALMIGGSQSMHGAITMAAKACSLSGVGTLTCMIPDVIADLLGMKMDTTMRLIAPSQEGAFSQKSIELLKKNIDSYDVISIGNGMGRSSIPEKLVEICLKSDKPILLDADAFWAIKEKTSLLDRQAPTLLSPHLRELSYIFNEPMESIVKDPLRVAKAFSKRYPNCTLVLKSSITIVSKADSQFVLYAPNSALAKGGSGDILCGILTGLYAQSKDDLEAAKAAVYLHACLAKQEIDPASLQMEDLLNAIPKNMQILRKKTQASV